MTKKTRRILCAALATLMTSSLVIEGGVRMNAEGASLGQSVTSNATSVDFKNVTGQFDTTALTAANFNSSVLENENAAQTQEHGLRTVIVSLAGKSLAESAGDEAVGDYLQTQSGKTRAQVLRTAQDDFLAALTSKKISYKLKNRYTAVDNALAIEINTRHVETISAMNGVESVVLSQTYSEPMTADYYGYATAAATGGVAEYVNETNVYETGIYNTSQFADRYAGEGMVVAILDTGLDYTHEAFQTLPPEETLALPLSSASGDSVSERFASYELKAEERAASTGKNLTASDVYVSAKVPFAYDYADDDADVYPSYSNHGTHVAGIIGGKADSYTDKDGNVAKDDQGNVLPFIGAAPNAQLVICKVFTDDLDSKDLGGAITEDVLAALEDCVMLGVDVINMSLGTTGGFTSTVGDDEGDYMNAVYTSIQDAGISLIVAASNDYSSGYGGTFGTNRASNPDSGTIGSPATYPAALAVASISGQKSPYIVANGETPVFYYESSDENSMPYDFADMVLGEDGTKTAEAFEYVVIPGVGAAADYTLSVRKLLKEKPRFALVSRGDTTFQEKVELARDMGAIGIIVYNNVAGMIHMNLGEVKKIIPAISISLEAGQAMKKGAIGGADGDDRVGEIRLDRTYLAGPFMSEFSSWGATPDLRLKPEITAHGGEITSTVPGGYDEQSGTSMAAPNMAGFTALARSYVETELSSVVESVMAQYGISRAKAVTRLVNQLSMSTATVARDQKGLPYSPRKQGAGLATLSGVIGGTSVYLSSMDEEIDYRPRIEVFDQAFSKNEVSYDLHFAVTNFGAAALTFHTEAVVMTETVSVDGFAVGEQAYLLEKCQESAQWFINGKAHSGAITVQGGETLNVSVRITLDETEKNYIETNFKNGMYVEGFLKLLSTAEGQCDLSIPFLGFYGDWAAAPMLDYSAFEISAAEQDSSIDDDQKPQASVFATQPFSAYYNERYILPMGGYVYVLPDDADPMYANEEYCSVSRYNEFYSDDGVDVDGNSNYMTSTRVQAIYAGLLRNAKRVEYTLVDEATGEVIHTDTIHRVGKAYNGGSATGTPGNVKLELTPDDYGLVANGRYRMNFEFFLDYGDGSANKNSYSFSFTVDYESPTLQDARIRYETYKDQYNNEKQRIYLDLDVFDNHYAQSAMLCYLRTDGVLEDGLTPKNVLQLATEYVTPVRDAVKNGKTTVSIEITDIYKDVYGSDRQLYVQLDDYSLNNSLYHLDLSKANAASLPDTFELLADDKVSVTKNAQGKTVGTLTLDIYETHKVSLGFDGNASLSNFTWNKMTIKGGKVDVKNGEIVGLQAGTARVSVSNGKETRYIEVTVTDTKRNLDIPNISFGTIEDTQSLALLKAQGLVNVFAGKQFALTVEADPWYYPKDKIQVRWSSLQPTIASVDENGVVSTLKEGVAIIRAELLDENGNATGSLASVTLNVEDEFIVSNFTLTDYNGLGWNQELTDENGNTIKALVIPADENIMYIGEEAFKDNTAVEYVVVPKSVVHIQEDAFENCTALKKVYFISTEAQAIPDSKLTLIMEQAFRGCTSLERLDLSNVKKTTLGREAFMDCVALSRVEKWSAIGTMHDRAFAGCIGLTEVDLSGLHMCGDNVFEGCTNIENVITGEFTELGNGMFAGCNKITSLTLNTPNIGARAFANCKGLQSVTFASPMGKSLSFTVGDSAFEGCTSLQTVRFGGETVRSLGARAFANTALTQFTMPTGVSVYGSNVLANTGVTSVTITDDFRAEDVSFLGISFAELSVTLSEDCAAYKIENGALYTADGKALIAATKDAPETFMVANGTERIGEYAFAGVGIKEVSIPNSVTEVGEGAFSGSTLQTVTFANEMRLLAIAAYLFQNTGVTNVELPDSVESIGDYAFAGSSLQSLAFNGSAIGDYAFAGCKQLTGLTLGESVETLGAYAFADCTSLKNVTLSAVKEVGAYAFYSTPALQAVTFGADDVAIGEGAFASVAPRTVLKTVLFEGTVKAIPDYAFYNCSGLQEINLRFATKAQGGTQSIGNYAFFSCTALQRADGLEQVENIGDYAFYRCNALQSVTLTEAVSVGEWAFGVEGENAYATLSFPKVKRVGSFAFFGNGAAAVDIPASLQSLGVGAFANARNLSAFNCVNNENFFVEEGVLYRKVADGVYELTSYPAAKVATEKTYEVKDGTVRVGAYAMAYLGAGNVERVNLPYSVKAIGDCAFYRSGVTDFVFESIQAPTLEYVYDAGVTQYIAETLLAERQAYGVNYRGYYYANFETCIVDYSAYGKLESQLTVHRPTNGVGYENHVYATYFAKTVETGVKMDDTTRAALTLIDEMPDSEELASWLTWDPADAEKRAAVEELSAKAKQARAYVERVLLDEVQSSYLGTQPIEKLEAVETQLRRIKAHFGIAVKVYRLTYDPTSYKKEYKAGETFDMTGLKITVEYDDGSKEEADLSKMTLVTGPLTLNNRTVTLTGYGMEIGILVSVTEGDVTPDTPVEEKGGCGSLVGVPVCGLAVLAAAMVIRKKRKENYV